ncbi:MAG: YceD family protein [Myxococcota bacterium]
MAVDGLPATGRVLAFGLGEPWAQAAAATALDRPPEHLKGEIRIKRANQHGGPRADVVIVDIEAATGAPATCDRCGEACELRIDLDTRLLYAPEGEEGEPDSAAFDGVALDDPSGRGEGRLLPDAEEIDLASSDELDLGWYQDGELILEDVLCEALSLAAPSRVVCADRAACDERTNELLAAGSTAASPFAALAGFRPGNDNDAGAPPTRGEPAEED